MKTPVETNAVGSDLAAGFAAQLAAWALRQGCEAATAGVLERIAHELTSAIEEGHVCIDLDRFVTGAEAAPGHDALRRRLVASGLVATPDVPGAAPLILDAEDRIYLHRHYDDERRLARRLLQAAAMDTGALDDAMRLQFRALFPQGPGGASAATDWQQVAAALALRRGLAIISGGPGTGKTTTVVKLLACLLARNADLRIALAAPTGKAAARMVEALRARATQLPDAIRARLPTQAHTVHRLLGLTSRNGRGRHDAQHPLPIDVLVVDEASMLDLGLATRLLDAAPLGARIILLGDKDQLEAVESGAVFAEISADPALGAAIRTDLASLCGVAPESIAPPAVPGESALPDSVVWFTDSHRFAEQSGIGRLATRILREPPPAVTAWLRSANDPSVRWLAGGDASRDGAPDLLESIVAGFDDYIRSLQVPRVDPATITAAFGRFRVLCALRDGPRGTRAINEQLQRVLAAASADAPGAPAQGWPAGWCPGLPVMVRRNDYSLGLFNGDVGIALAGAGGELRVWFAGPEGGFRSFSPAQLPSHETAFAMTVHKSQGSEFEHVLVLLPDRPVRVVSRELLYTAVTRARSRVTLCASAAVLEAAIGAPGRRRSGLRARLREAREAREPGPG